VIRSGQEQKTYIVVENEGNVNVPDTTVWIQVSASDSGLLSALDLSADFPVFSFDLPGAPPLPADLSGFFIPIDNNTKVGGVDVRDLPPQIPQVLPIIIKPPVNAPPHEHIELTAKVNDAACILTKIEKGIDCLLDVLQIVLDFGGLKASKKGNTLKNALDNECRVQLIKYSENFLNTFIQDIRKDVNGKPITKIGMVKLFADQLFNFLTPLAEQKACLDSIAKFSGIPGGLSTSNLEALLRRGLQAIAEKFGEKVLQSLAPGVGTALLWIDFAVNAKRYIDLGLDLYAAIMDCLDFAKTLWESSADKEIRTPQDPNDKAGPQGAGPQGYISGTAPLPYIIFFQNLPTATAPAQKVVITDQLDPNVDSSNFSLGPISFGNQTVVPPPGLSTYSTVVDLRPATNLLVDISASLNSSTRVATWTYQSIDPGTGQPPTDPLVGFLPPDVNPPEGEGGVLFTVMPKAGLSTGTQISNQATVVFDVNAPISTQTWVNTIDNTPPTSSVLALPATESSPSFQVQWSGSDVGSRIQDFSIYVSDNGGAFTLWQVNTTATSAAYTGQVGHTYGFYSIARDLVGNMEAPKTTAEATTTVTATPSPPSPGALKGDIDGDGKVDLQDIILIADFLTGKQDLTPAQQAAADVDGDGKIDIFDIIEIARYLAGLVTQLGVERSQPYNLALARPLMLKSETKSLAPGEIATVRLLASSDLLGIQVGPQGRLTWDPKVIHVRDIRGIEPYRVLASNIDNERGEARFVALDMSKKEVKTEAMLEVVLDATGPSGASTFLKLTPDMAIDRQGRPVNLQMEPVPVIIGPPVPLAVRGIKVFPTPVSDAESVQFLVEGRAIRGLQVQVYDLDGRKVFTSPEIEGENRLSWNLLNDQGQTVANGVYLYLVTVRGFNGEIYVSRVQKMVVLRQ
jgi:hypothetical protein